MLSSVASCIVIKPIATLSIKSDSCDRPIVLWPNVSEKQVLSCRCFIKCCDTSVQSGPVTSNYPLSKRVALGVSQGGESRWHNDIFRGSLFGTSHQQRRGHNFLKDWGSITLWKGWGWGAHIQRWVRTWEKSGSTWTWKYQKMFLQINLFRN